MSRNQHIDRCPKCKSDDVHCSETMSDNPHREWMQVSCEDCHFEGNEFPYDTEADEEYQAARDAISEWNAFERLSTVEPHPIQCERTENAASQPETDVGELSDIEVLLMHWHAVDSCQYDDVEVMRQQIIADLTKIAHTESAVAERTRLLQARVDELTVALRIAVSNMTHPSHNFDTSGIEDMPIVKKMVRRFDRDLAIVEAALSQVSREG